MHLTCREDGPYLLKFLHFRKPGVTNLLWMPHKDNHSSRKRDFSLDRTAVKALVAVYGPREAARQANLPVGTVLSWSRRYKWKKASFIPRGTGINGDKPGDGRDAGDVLRDALEKHREESTLHLAKFTANASKQAAKSTNPLDVARKVRDVAGVYATLWPAEEGSELMEGAILIGAAKVTDNPREMLAITENLPIQEADVREELPDQRPEGD